MNTAVTRSPSGASGRPAPRATSGPAAPRRSGTTPGPPGTRSDSSRPSAGTRSPASSTTTSPGTSSSASSRTMRPSRRTVAVVVVICRSASSADSARDSWVKPMTPLSSTTTSDRDRGLPLAGHCRADHRRGQQDQDHRALELAQEHPPPRLPGRLRQPVGTVPLQPASRLRRRQAGPRIHLQPARHLLGGHRVPGRRQGVGGLTHRHIVPCASGSGVPVPVRRPRCGRRRCPAA